MASHLHLHTPYTPSPKTVFLTQLSILLAVIMTGLVSMMLVRSQLEQHQIQPEQIPIAEQRVWNALGR